MSPVLVVFLVNKLTKRQQFTKVEVNKCLTFIFIFFNKKCIKNKLNILHLDTSRLCINNRDVSNFVPRCIQIQNV